LRHHPLIFFFIHIYIQKGLVLIDLPSRVIAVLQKFKRMIYSLTGSRKSYVFLKFNISRRTNPFELKFVGYARYQ
jgi:hypothetical protein